VNKAGVLKCVFPILRDYGDCVELLGCGCLFSFRSKLYVVSCVHVIKHLEHAADDIGIPDGPELGTSHGVSTLGRGKLWLTGEDVYDVGVFRLDDPNVVARLASAGWVPLTETDICSDGIPAGDRCIVVGWPLSGVKVTYDTMLNPVGQMFIVDTRRMNTPQAFPATSPMPIHPADLFFEWPGKETPDLVGISGSPVWTVRSESKGVVYPAPEFKVIGVEHRVHIGSYIRGTHWGIVMRTIEQGESVV
jgi:hypothetical protein